MRVDKSKWERKTFDDACVIIHGKDHKAVNNPEGKYPIYGSGGIMGRANSYLCESGTTIIGRKGTINSPIYVNERFWNIDTAFGLFPKENIDSKYLYYYCKNFDFTKIQSGAAIPSLTRKDILKQTVIIPPPAEQQGIAAELDAIQTMIDGYREQLADLDALAQSIFLDTFGDPISNPKDWEVKPLKFICNKISTGPFGSMLHKTDYSDNGVPTINPQDISRGRIKTESIAKVTLSKYNELSKYILAVGNIVIARRGDLSKCAIISDNEKGWLCGTGSFFMELTEVLLPIIFFYIYTSKTIQKHLNEKCIGATMPNLNQGILAALNIPIPPLSLQQQFAAQVEAIEKQKELLRQQIADAETLMAERMQYYFS